VNQANKGELSEARDEVRGFLRRLCNTTVLDPACGTGNFLYVTLEHMKRLEGEVLDALKGFGETQAAFEGFGLTVDPHQFRGIEVNPRAAAIADLVLWIGYLQWHFRTYGDRMPAEPIIHAYHNIECRDAVLAFEGPEAVRDERGEPVTRWDGITSKPHPVTGEQVPDETARIGAWKYHNPCKAEWPAAEFIVGNPPFIGNKRMRLALGDGYVEALRAAWKGVPDTVDYVMYWWTHAAEHVKSGMPKRFGFITTNSITQTYNRKVLSRAFQSGLSLRYAVPDHPWVDASDGAAVRVAFTVASAEDSLGRLEFVVDEKESGHDTPTLRLRSLTGTINQDLSCGANITSVGKLKSNENLSFMGVTVLGEGFVVTPSQAACLNLGDPVHATNHLRIYRNGKDLTDKPRGLLVMDFFGLTEQEVVRNFPAAYQWIVNRVKPEREAKAHTKDGAGYARLWWQFAKPRSEMRKALAGLARYIATCRTAKHRVFSFLEGNILPDAKLIAVASDDAYILGVLSSKAHVIWSLRTGAFLGVGNDSNYNNSECFNTFAFPRCTESFKSSIRAIGEKLDDHRKRQQSAHFSLTLTGMYNVLAKLGSGDPLTDKDRAVHDQGLVSILKKIHDELDVAVFDAYGWPHELTNDEILGRLVDLNRERAAEEARGVVRWLRPEFQNPEGAKAATQATLPIPTDDEPTSPEAPAAPVKKQPWPKPLAEQAQAVRAALAASPGGMTPDQLAKTFLRARVDRVTELLETLESLGQARVTPKGYYVRL